MDTLSFLQRVLPTDGLYCAMFLEGGKARHGFFGSVEELAAASLKLDALELSIYYAVSSFDERRRKQENVHGTKVIAIDLDVGDTGRKYPTWQDALKDLGRFVAQAQLPKPMVIHSGVGLHAYWVLTETLMPAQWKPLATSMKSLATANGLRIDPTVTADSARVLRAIGTTNRKNGKAVRLLIDAPDVDPEDLRSCFGTTATVTVQPAPQRSSGLADSLSVKYDYPPANGEVIASKCAQIRWAVENQNDVPEPFWYSLMGVAAFCREPEKVALKWSQEHEGFDANATLRKMYQWQSAATGPSTCTRLESERPAGCKGCPYKSKIGTPARLGLQYDEVAVAANAPDPVALAIPVPKPFKRTASGMKLTIDDTDLDVCPFDIYPVSYGRDDALSYEVVRFQWNRAHAGWQPLVLRHAYLSDGHREFASAIADQGIVLANKKQTEFFQLMLRSYVASLQQTRAMTNLYTTMGWKEKASEFVLGNTVIRNTAKGVVEEPINLSSGSQRLGSELWTQSGTLEDWVAFTNLLQKGKMPWHMFALTVGISAPLYYFTGLKGMTLSLYGPTGGGKTLIQYWQQSVWGDPDKLHFTAKFTQNALFSRLGLYCHLPMTIDEATMVDDKDVGDFLYWVSQGRDKARMTRQIEEREARTWATPNTVSTNKSWNSKLTASGLETDAQMARLLEINVPQHALFLRDSNAGRRIYQFLSSNYGTMGRAFIGKLIALGEDGIRAMIAEHTSKFAKLYNCQFAGQERYWEQMVILADLAGKLCQEWGLIDFEYTLGTQWVLEQMGAIRKNMAENKIDIFDILTEYMNEYAGTAVTVMHTVGQKALLDHARVPRSDIRIRFDIYRATAMSKFDKGTVLIDRTHFRKWLARRGVDYKTFMNEIDFERVDATPKSGKASLAKDTPIKLGQSYVIGLNLSHKRLAGILDEAEQAAEDLIYGQLKAVQ